jgi:beta-galactosidase
LNGKSLGRKKKGEYEYRLRWDDVIYESGEVKAIAYKDGKKWAEKIISTSGEPAMLKVSVDRIIIKADEKDLSFVTVQVCDKGGLPVSNADNVIEFEVAGVGDVIATDNGDPNCFVPFDSPKRNAFGGLCMGIVKGEKNNPGKIIVKVMSDGLQSDSLIIVSE